MPCQKGLSRCRAPRVPGLACSSILAGPAVVVAGGRGCRCCLRLLPTLEHLLAWRSPGGIFKHFHLPKPLHGWREFAGEVGIIVLGVLIALGFEQLVDDIHWRSEVQDFRKAVRAEISNDLATYTYRNEENRCVVARLDELQRWLDSWRAGGRLKLAGPIGMPDSLVVRTGVWDSRDAGTMSHIPLSEKLAYSGLYTEFANNEVHRLDERAAWLELAEFDAATEVDHQDMMRLQGLIKRARQRLRRMTNNAGRFMKRAAEIGIRPVPDPTWPAPDTHELCGAILQRGNGAAG